MGYLQTDENFCWTRCNFKILLEELDNANDFLLILTADESIINPDAIFSEKKDQISGSMT